MENKVQLTKVSPSEEKKKSKHRKRERDCIASIFALSSLISLFNYSSRSRATSSRKDDSE